MPTWTCHAFRLGFGQIALYSFFFSSRRRHTSWPRDWSSDVCSSDLSGLGHALLRQGELTPARRVLEEGVALQRQIGERWVLASSLDALGQLATEVGHFAEARAALRESLLLREDMGDSVNMLESLESIAALAAVQKEPERA